jgi:RimJ/RimL family protein N-acetyltransferase
MTVLFETERLLFRPLELSDAAAMFEMDNNAEVHKYLWQTPTQKIEETIKVIEYVQSQYAKHAIGRYATILKETGEFIGWTGIKFVDDHVENGNTNFFDYGYRLNEKFWGNGYATESTIFWLAHGFDKMNIETMHAYTHAENGASNRVLSKCGMSFMEDYPDESGVLWKWWQMKNTNL